MDVRSPGTGVTKGCELLYGCWDLNTDSLEKHSVEKCLYSLRVFSVPAKKILSFMSWL